MRSGILVVVVVVAVIACASVAQCDHSPLGVGQKQNVLATSKADEATTSQKKASEILKATGGALSRETRDLASKADCGDSGTNERCIIALCKRYDTLNAFSWVPKGFYLRAPSVQLYEEPFELCRANSVEAAYVYTLRNVYYVYYPEELQQAWDNCTRNPGSPQGIMGYYNQYDEYLWKYTVPCDGLVCKALMSKDEWDSPLFYFVEVLVEEEKTDTRSGQTTTTPKRLTNTQRRPHLSLEDLKYFVHQQINICCPPGDDVCY